MSCSSQCSSIFMHIYDERGQVALTAVPFTRTVMSAYFRVTKLNITVTGVSSMRSENNLEPFIAPFYDILCILLTIHLLYVISLVGFMIKNICIQQNIFYCHFIYSRKTRVLAGGAALQRPLLAGRHCISVIRQIMFLYFHSRLTHCWTGGLWILSDTRVCCTAGLH